MKRVKAALLWFATLSQKSDQMEIPNVNMNRAGFTGEQLVQLLGRFLGGVQDLIEVLLSFLRRDIADFRM